MLKVNLLPPKEKKELELARLYNFIVFFEGWIFALVVLFILLLAVVYFHLSILVKAQSQLIELEQSDVKSQRLIQIENKIKQANETISRVDNNQKDIILLTPILEKVSEITPPGLYLTNFGYQDKTKEIDLNGRADYRENLLKFQKSLEETAMFVGLEAPLSNLLKQKDIDFNFKFKIKDLVGVEKQ